MEEKRPTKPRYDLKSRQTIETVQTLLDRGVTKMSVIIRHSDRHYHKDPKLEAFMGLTESGKTFAFDMGRALPAVSPQLFASHFGRCIETAYLLDKGFTREHGNLLTHPETCDLLAPFYIKRPEDTMRAVMEMGSRPFIRAWFRGDIDPGMIQDPKATADVIADFMLERLDALPEKGLAVCVSHDWNIYPVREFMLNLPHETAGDVGYLDGIVFFREGGRAFAASYQSDPRPL